MSGAMSYDIEGLTTYEAAEAACHKKQLYEGSKKIGIHNMFQCCAYYGGSKQTAKEKNKQKITKSRF